MFCSNGLLIASHISDFAFHEKLLWKINFRKQIIINDEHTFDSIKEVKVIKYLSTILSESWQKVGHPLSIWDFK
jgi:hypothetical protein